MQTFFIGLTLLVSYCNGLIVPQEWASILSVVNGVVAPVVKGTDSKVGFGFQLGNHADYQILFEIGPQKFTKPLGGDSDDSSGNNKRMADQVKYNKRIRAIQIKNESSSLQKKANVKQKNRKSEIPTKRPTQVNKPFMDTKNQYPLPIGNILSKISLQILQQAVGPSPSSKSMEARIPTAARKNAAKVNRTQKVKTDLSDVSLDD